MTTPLVAARDVRFRYSGAASDAVADVSLELAAGELLAIVGPNGCGKTTLLRLLSGALQPAAGTVEVGGIATARWDRKGLAREIAVVSQREEPAFPLRVEQAVMLGRYPHFGWWGAPAQRDRDVVRSALERCDIADLGARWVATLSGGEWQRVRVARALAQEPRVLLLDEATSNLDLRHEMEVFELASGLVHDAQLAGVFITHHVNLAARFADQVLVLQRGRPQACGAPSDVLTADLVHRVFEWPVDVQWWRQYPQFIPLASREPQGETR